MVNMGAVSCHAEIFMIVISLLCMQASSFNPGKSRTGLDSSSSRSGLLWMRTESNPYDNVILYDGVCNFCNTWVDICLQADKEKGVFMYAPLQSKAGGDLLTKIGKERGDISSVVLVKQDKTGAFKGYSKSEAAVQVLKELDVPAFSPLAVLIAALLPSGLKDGLYDEVAKRRYDFMGKRSTMERLDELSIKYADRFLP